MYRHITEFTTYLHSNRVKQHTINAYIHDVYQWSIFCMEQGVYDVAYIQQHHVNAYMRNLYYTYITHATAQRKCSALRSFFRYYALTVEVPEIENTIDIFCSNHDITAVYTQLFSADDMYKRRDGCMIAMQYELSASYQYITSLKLHEIVFYHTTATIRGHRISQSATRYLYNYITHDHPYILQSSAYDTPLAFPYIRTPSDIMKMPYRTYTRKLRHYLAKLHTADSPHLPFGNETHDNDIDTTLQRKYYNFHDRA